MGRNDGFVDGKWIDGRMVQHEVEKDFYF